jgi:hypothetical protein
LASRSFTLRLPIASWSTRTCEKRFLDAKPIRRSLSCTYKRLLLSHRSLPEKFNPKASARTRDPCLNEQLRSFLATPSSPSGVSESLVAYLPFGRTSRRCGMTKTSCLAINCLLLLFCFSFIPRGAAHSFLICTHLQEDVPGQECSDIDNYPVHRKIDQCVGLDPKSILLTVCRQAGHGYWHQKPGPLCQNGTGKLLARSGQ